MHQICEYCRSRVDRDRDECKNCGAPVPKLHPEYNMHGSPYFAPTLELLFAAQQSQNANLGLYAGRINDVYGLGNIQQNYLGNAYPRGWAGIWWNQ